ncbi:peptidase MA superfamily [Orgyia pseudotsugata single capsid nuclopolyhedrovirus]|nr:peptidase MA superfamily [Orgyia pseudotsugata single capsid nuclopolyhedrovirus]
MQAFATISIVPLLLMTIAQCGSDMYVVGNAVDITSLIDIVCVPRKFVDVVCDGNRLLERFERETFDFGANVDDIKRYGEWLRLLNNLHYFKPKHNRLRTIKSIAVQCRRWVRLNKGITHEMQIVSAEVFRWTSDTWSRYHESVNRDLFDSTAIDFIDFFNTFVIWCDTDSLYFFKTIMHAYRYVRHANPLLIDYAAKNTIKLVLNYPLVLMAPATVKQAFFVLYVNYVPFKYHMIFTGYYTKIEKDLVMPHAFSFGVGPFNFTVHHNTRSARKCAAMKHQVYYVYKNTRKFLKAVNVDFRHTLDQIEVFVYDNKTTYEAMGPLWAIRTNNGGYTHVNTQLKKIESHVYYESDELPRNYGHEVQHTLMYAIDKANDAPLWFIEGIANRLGNRYCYPYDHETMKSHKTTTMAQIIAEATSYNGDTSDMVYGMGSALSEFLYKTRPILLGNMIKRNNYTLFVDKSVEDEFDVFRKNKIIECDMYIERSRNLRNNSGGDDDDVQFNTRAMYLQALNKTTRFVCKNYIQFEFDDVIYVMTVKKLIKTNKYNNSGGAVNVQKEIRFNDVAVSQFDYQWFLKGTLKHTLRYFGDTADALRIDAHYTYISVVSCDGVADGKVNTNLQEMIARFSFESGVWDSVSYLKNMNYEKARNFVRQYAAALNECREFINPVVVGGRASFPLTTNALDVRYLKAIKLSDTEKQLRVDGRGNTIVHLLALFNHYVYKNSTNDKVETIKNYDNRTPRDLYTLSLRYINSFHKTPNRFCFTALNESFDVNVATFAHNNDAIVSTKLESRAPKTTTASTTTATTLTLITIVPTKPIVTSTPFNTTSTTTTSTTTSTTGITIVPATTNTMTMVVVTESPITTMAPIAKDRNFMSTFNDVVNETIDKLHFELAIMYKNNKTVFWCIVLFIIILIILVNICITTLIVKKCVKNIYTPKSPTMVKYNKGSIINNKIDKSINEDECTIQLVK